MRSLSGGNQQRVVLARELSTSRRVLVAAQPTRGLDVGAIEYMTEPAAAAAAERASAVLLISTELEEILTLAHRIVRDPRRAHRRRDGRARGRPRAPRPAHGRGGGVSDDRRRAASTAGRCRRRSSRAGRAAPAPLAAPAAVAGRAGSTSSRSRVALGLCALLVVGDRRLGDRGVHRPARRQHPLARRMGADAHDGGAAADRRRRHDRRRARPGCRTSARRARCCIGAASRALRRRRASSRPGRFVDRWRCSPPASSAAALWAGLAAGDAVHGARCPRCISTLLLSFVAVQLDGYGLTKHVAAAGTARAGLTGSTTASRSGRHARFRRPATSSATTSPVSARPRRRAGASWSRSCWPGRCGLPPPDARAQPARGAAGRRRRRRTSAAARSWSRARSPGSPAALWLTGGVRRRPLHPGLLVNIGWQGLLVALLARQRPLVADPDGVRVRRAAHRVAASCPPPASSGGSPTSCRRCSCWRCSSPRPSPSMRPAAPGRSRAGAVATAMIARR